MITGIGQPLHFRCSKCRKARRWPQGGKTRVKLTYRTKQINDGNARGRSTNVLREYECLDCGHIGWSRHIDLVRR